MTTATAPGARLLTSSAALLWGLQLAFLVPTLALLLVALYDATPGEVGWVLAVYNGAGFVATLLLPAWADRRGDYLHPLGLCALLTVALAAVLAATTSLPVAVVALLVLGAPAGVGVTLLFAHLRHSGAGADEVVRTRAVVSFAWVAGPPLATLLVGSLGNRAVLVALAVVAVLNVATTLGLLARQRGAGGDAAARAPSADGGPPVTRAVVALVVVAFVALQATNSSVVAVMSLFVTRDLGLDVVWAGVALGVSAGLEIPALLLAGRLSRRVPDLSLVVTGCLAGVAYYVGMALVGGPVALLLLQVLNAWFFAVVAGVGLALFQRVVPRPGLASGLYANTRRVGGVVSGPVIGVGATTALGYSGVFALCAALTVLALVLVVVAGRAARPPTTDTSSG